MNKPILLFFALITLTHVSFTQSFTDANVSLTEGQFTKYEFVDIDNDNDLDLFSITTDTSGEINLFINNGMGDFTLDTTNTFPSYLYANAAFADVDGDSDFDLILIGGNESNTAFTTLYFNNGTGILTPDTNSFEGAFNGDVDFADVDNDGDLDVFISGFNSFADFRTRLYFNDGTGTFLAQTPFVFENTQNSENIFADFNNDGFIDVFQTGRNTNNDLVSKLFSNDGNGNFTEVTNTPFQAIELGDVDVSDIDNDGDLDLVLTGGLLEFTLYTKLYRNDGNFSFTELTNSGLAQLNFSDVHFADVDNDNDEDLLLCGIDATSTRQTLLYNNDGNGNFSLVNNLPFDDINHADIKSADIDNDGDLDLVIGGLKDPNSVDRYSNKIFINNMNTLGLNTIQPPNTIEVLYQKTQQRIRINTSHIVTEVKIYNLNGQLIQKWSTTNTISTANLHEGLYLIQIKTELGMVTKKIILN